MQLPCCTLLGYSKGGVFQTYLLNQGQFFLLAASFSSSITCQQHQDNFALAVYWSAVRSLHAQCQVESSFCTVHEHVAFLGSSSEKTQNKTLPSTVSGSSGGLEATELFLQLSLTLSHKVSSQTTQQGERFDFL